MRPFTQLTIPQPCHESWAAMTPTATGRHCAACAKTVVDFTQLSDAEILEQLARAGRGGTCGRFRAGQLARPLQPMALAPARGWRGWLAAAVAVWGLREIGSQTAVAQTPMEQLRPDMQGPENLRARHREVVEGQRQVVLRGRVTDAASQEGLPGVTVLLKGTTVGVPTDTAGRFVLPVPPEYLTDGQVMLQLNYVGYLSQEHRIDCAKDADLQLALQLNPVVLGGFIAAVDVTKAPPAPWHPRRLYHWGKYWLTRPFK